MDKSRCNDDDSQSQLLDDQNLGSLSDGDLADSFNSDEPSKIELTKQELRQLEMATHGLGNSRWSTKPFLPDESLKFAPSVSCFKI